MLPPFPPTCPLPPPHTHKHTQLVRILVKLFLNSLVFSKLIEGAVWAPHRLSEVQIRTYLRATLGLEAPQPQWGLPTGWGHYLAGRGVARWGMVASVTLASSLNASGSEPGRIIWKQRTRGSFYGTDGYARARWCAEVRERGRGSHSWHACLCILSVSVP